MSPWINGEGASPVYILNRRLGHSQSMILLKLSQLSKPARSELAPAPRSFARFMGIFEFSKKIHGNRYKTGDSMSPTQVDVIDAG